MLIAAAKTLTPKTLMLTVATNTTTTITTHTHTHILTMRPQRLSPNQWPTMCLKCTTPPLILTRPPQTTTMGINTAPTTLSRNALAGRSNGATFSAGSQTFSSGSPTYSLIWPEMFPTEYQTPNNFLMFFRFSAKSS